MSNMQRNKGARGERELAKLLEENLGLEVTRNLLQTREGGYDLNGLPVALEVKRCEQLQLKRWWEQAMDQAIFSNSKKLPVLAWRQNGRKWTFRVPVTFFCGPCKTDWGHTADIGIDTFCLLIRELWL